MMDASRDLREKAFSIFRVRLLAGCWLWLHDKKPCVLSTASREFGVVRAAPLPAVLFTV